MAGSISLLVDSPLRDLAFALREVPSETKRQISRRTKPVADEVWFDELRSRASTRLQQRALVDSRQVSATSRNVFLRSGGRGTLSSGTPVSVVAAGAEFGMNPSRPVTQRSRKGNEYTRKIGPVFLAPRRQGYVVFESGKASISRVASLWIQTAARTLYDAAEGS